MATATPFIQRHLDLSSFPAFVAVDTFEGAIYEIARPGREAVLFPLADLLEYQHPMLGKWAREINEGGSAGSYLVMPFDTSEERPLGLEVGRSLADAKYGTPEARELFVAELLQISKRIDDNTGSPVRSAGVAGHPNFETPAAHLDLFHAPGYSLLAKLSGIGGTCVWPSTEPSYGDFADKSREMVEIRRELSATGLKDLSKQVGLIERDNELVEELSGLKPQSKPFQVPDGWGLIIRTGAGGTLHAAAPISGNITEAEREKLMERAVLMLDWAAIPPSPLRMIR